MLECPIFRKHQALIIINSNYFSVLKNVFYTLEMLYVHVSPPLNCSKLISIQSKLELRKDSVLRICDTRWVCRFKNCDSMIKNYPGILKFI